MFGSVSLPPAWLHRLGQLTRQRPALEFERAATDPAGTQRAYLQRLLERNRETVYGREHGFAEIRTPADYARRVPLMTPDDLAHWVGRLKQGERNLLTAEAPVFYGVSTGTTGHHKEVPITPAYRAEFQRTVNVAFWHLFRQYPGAFTSKFLYFVGPRRFEVAPDGHDIGAISGYNFTEQPPLIRSLYAWPYELFLITDLETRSYMALHQAILGDISLITGVFPLPIVAMLRNLEVYAEVLESDLRRGTLDGAKALSAEQRSAFTRHLRPRPDLADRLRRSIAAPVEEKAAIVFPKLALTYCWVTSTAGLYVPELQRRLGGGVQVRDAIFAATEAWCNIPMGDAEPGGPLATEVVYGEFIPEAAFEAGSRETLTVSELEDGQRYYLVTSNASGLYRYVLGDVIEVCGRYKATPRIRFVRKGGAASNMAGELLDESHVNVAVAKALADCGLEATWFALVADPAGAVPRYVLHLEPAPAQAGLEPSELARLLGRVEARLTEEAYNYGLRRKSGLLGPMGLVRVPQGRYDAWRQAKVAAGRGEAQLKTVHLVGDPQALPEEFRQGAIALG